MEVRMFDLLVLFGLAILVSTIICYHIVDTINNKLSNIAINIPTPVCPQPRIIIRSNSGDREITPPHVQESDEGRVKSIQSIKPDESNKLYEEFADLVMYPDADYIVDMPKKCNNLNKNTEQYQMMKVPGSNCGIPVQGTKMINSKMIGADGKFTENNITMIVPQTFMGRDEFMEGTNTFNPFESDQASPIDQLNLLGRPSQILQPYNEYHSY